MEEKHSGPEFHPAWHGEHETWRKQIFPDLRIFIHYLTLAPRLQRSRQGLRDGLKEGHKAFGMLSAVYTLVIHVVIQLPHLPTHPYTRPSRTRLSSSFLSEALSNCLRNAVGKLYQLSGHRTIKTASNNDDNQ